MNVTAIDAGLAPAYPFYTRFPDSERMNCGQHFDAADGTQDWIRLGEFDGPDGAEAQAKVLFRAVKARKPDLIGFRVLDSERQTSRAMECASRLNAVRHARPA